MVSKTRNRFLRPFYEGNLKNKLTAWVLAKKALGMTIGLTGTVCCLVFLFMGMRRVMDVGGFVASGGPYHIAHQAPGWIWIMPVSIFGSIFFIFLNFTNARRIGGPKLLLFLWPALFLSLGYNFLEYTFFPPGNHQGIVIGWLICGILFVLMGGIPLLVVVVDIFKGLRTGRSGQTGSSTHFQSRTEKDPAADYIHPGRVTFLVGVLTLASVGGGVYLGYIVFQALSS